MNHSLALQPEEEVAGGGERGSLLSRSGSTAGQWGLQESREAEALAA